ncbi:MAG: S-adenosylmethionine decarboxylase [Leptospiraceae bacterium]|nr:S-adenosylmethionine decarboxylase [Leptospiraceae bacterium]MCP5512659.1 S-adenosylmethionine decarboxylase [Leptospiraceae bacterium]
MGQVRVKARIFNFSAWITEVRPDSLRERFHFLLERCGFEILGFQEHFFQPEGYTALWLLGESHFAIHTFPEERKSYLELSSCNYDFFKMFKEEVGQDLIVEESV